MSHDETECTDGSAAGEGAAAGRSTRPPRRFLEGILVFLACGLLFFSYGGQFCVIGLLVLAVGGWIAARLGRRIRGSVLRRLAPLIALLVLTAALVGVGYYSTTPRMLFRRYVASPIPPSVRVLASGYFGGIDPCAAVRFTASPEDMNAILRGRPYKVVPLRDFPSIPPLRPKGPWDPQSFVSPTLYSWGEAPSPVAFMLVNQDRTEAYFAFLTF